MMKPQRRAIAWMALTLILGGGMAGFAEQHAEGQTEMTPEMQAEMEFWMKLAQPGEHHQHLAPFEGQWKGEVRMWMAPGAEPMVDESVANASWIMGGRFLQWKHSGQFQGMPFEGLAIEGFNNGDARYESTWIDNFGTIVLYYTGSCSDEGKSRVMTSQFSDPMTGGTIHYKALYTWVDEDHFTYEALMDKGDGEFKNLEIRYERQ